MNNILTVGKYKGKSFQEVYDRHKKYAVYIQIADIRNPSLLEFRKWMKDQEPIVGPTKFILGRGSNIDDIIGEPDIIYHGLNGQSRGKHLEWVAKNKLYSQYGAFIDHLIRYLISYELDLPSKDWRSEDIIEKYSETTTYIPRLKKSYQRYTSILPIDDVLPDIWIVSLSHGFWFNRKLKKLNRLERLSKKIPSQLIDQSVFDNITDFIGMFDLTSSELNPRLSCDGIPLIGDADIILENTLIDIKTSSTYIGSKIDDFYQLYYYAMLRNLSDDCRKIKYLVIFNPLRGYFRKIDVSEFNWRSLADFC